MTRQDQFEKAYAAHHEVQPGTVKSLRFHDAESYSDPRVAHDYRIFCLALDSVDIELPGEYVYETRMHTDWFETIQIASALYAIAVIPLTVSVLAWWLI